MDIAALIISILSILISVALSIYEICESKKINEVSLESQYFDDLYKESLIKKIPMARAVITFDVQGKLVGTDDLTRELREIRKSSLYFLYADKKFYAELKTALQDLEDYIIDKENCTVLGEDQTEVFDCIHEKIKKIYDIMTTKYKGRKI